MPIWTALIPAAPQGLPPAPHDPGEPAGAAPALTATALAWWCLQFTPRVALLEEAVVLEWRASERLFGGRSALLRRLAAGAQAAGCHSWASASTALGALALARARPHGLELGLVEMDQLQALDGLPLTCLSAVAQHEATLNRLGCRTLGDVLRLPREGLSRRLGSSTLQALDQARGIQPEVLSWVTLPEAFDEQLELPGRVDNALALQHAADVLLQRMCAWLSGRHLGVRQFTLRWQHDGQRRDAECSGAWPVQVGSPSRDARQLSALVAEHLRQITLSAPVGELALRADTVEPLTAPGADLFCQGDAHQHLLQDEALRTPSAQRQQAHSLSGLLDKLAARLGAQRVRAGQLQADHRPEHQQVWAAVPPLPFATTRSPAAPSQTLAHLPSPTWLLPVPLPLRLYRSAPGQAERPFYQGPLTLLAGPHRVDAGWWAGPTVGRDYYLASSKTAGLLWVFKDRQAVPAGHSPWFLHGFFA